MAHTAMFSVFVMLSICVWFAMFILLIRSQSYMYCKCLAVQASAGNIAPKALKLPLKSFGPWAYNGQCSAVNPDKWGLGVCMLKAVGNPSKPQIVKTGASKLVMHCNVNT